MAGAALLALSALGNHARAQAIGVNILAFEGRSAGEFDLMDLATVAAHPIGAVECGATISFRFTNVDIMRAQLQFFQGANCNDVSVRTDTTNTSCQELPVPPDAIDMRAQQDVDIVAGDLVPCETGGSGVQTIWVLALNNPTDTVTGAGQSVSFPVAFDFVPPSAPSGLSVAPGENAARLTWSATTDQVSGYDVFVDPTGCTDTGEVVSPGLTGEPPDESLIVSSPSGAASSASAPYPDSVGTGQYMAVAVRAVDRAGNESPLSEVVCVQRIEVVSWWDTECGTGAHEYCNGGCAAAPAGGGRAAWLALPAAALALLALRRRIRR